MLQSLKQYKMHAIILSVLLTVIVSCALLNPRTIIYDTEACAILGAAGAQCAHTLTPETETMTKAEWDQNSIGWICMPSQGFNDTETALDQICNSTKECDYQTRQAIALVKARLHPVLKAALKAARGKT